MKHFTFEMTITKKYRFDDTDVIEYMSDILDSLTYESFGNLEYRLNMTEAKLILVRFLSDRLPDFPQVLNEADLGLIIESFARDYWRPRKNLDTAKIVLS